MIHPLFHRTRDILIYFAVWILPLLIHMAALILVMDFPFKVGLLDAVFSMTIFSLLGLSLWYITYGVKIETSGVFVFLGKHIIALIPFLAVWIFGSQLLLFVFVGADADEIEALMSLRIFKMLEGILLYTTIITVYYLINYYQETQRSKVNAEILQRNLRETELRVLKSQINPHFLFNSLNSISALSITQAEDARKTIVKLSQYLRYSLKMNPEDLVSLNEEIDNCKRYLDIESVRFGNKMHCNFEVQEECLKHNIPVLILQPLFENAVKHAVYETTEQVKIDTKILCDSDFIIIKIRNDFDPDAIPRKGEGVGLKSIKTRLKIIYGNQHFMSAIPQENEFIVTLKIPIHYENKTLNY